MFEILNPAINDIEENNNIVNRISELQKNSFLNSKLISFDDYLFDS